MGPSSSLLALASANRIGSPERDTARDAISTTALAPFRHFKKVPANGNDPSCPSRCSFGSNVLPLSHLGLNVAVRAPAENTFPHHRANARRAEMHAAWVVAGSERVFTRPHRRETLSPRDLGRKGRYRPELMNRGVFWSKVSLDTPVSVIERQYGGWRWRGGALETEGFG